MSFKRRSSLLLVLFLAAFVIYLLLNSLPQFLMAHTNLDSDDIGEFLNTMQNSNFEEDKLANCSREANSYSLTAPLENINQLHEVFDKELSNTSEIADYLIEFGYNATFKSLETNIAQFRSLSEFRSFDARSWNCCMHKQSYITGSERQGLRLTQIGTLLIVMYVIQIHDEAADRFALNALLGLILGLNCEPYAESLLIETGIITKMAKVFADPALSKLMDVDEKKSVLNTLDVVLQTKHYKRTCQFEAISLRQLCINTTAPHHASLSASTLSNSGLVVLKLPNSSWWDYLYALALLRRAESTSNFRPPIWIFPVAYRISNFTEMLLDYNTSLLVNGSALRSYLLTK